MDRKLFWLGLVAAIDRKSFWLGAVAALVAVAALGRLDIWSFLSALCLIGFLPLLYAVKIYCQRGTRYALAAFVIGLIIGLISSFYIFLLLALVVETLDAAWHRAHFQPGRKPAIASQTTGQKPGEVSHDSSPS